MNFGQSPNGKIFKRAQVGRRRRLAMQSAVAFGFLLAGLFLSVRSEASDIEWGGLYRFEGLRFNNPELNGAKADKAYMLHHLILAPKVVVADGMTVHGRFDLLNNAGFGTNNQAGEFIGKGVGTGTPTSADNSNVLSKNQEAGGLAVSQLYFSWNQEFGQLIAGRAPMHFGLGTWFNSGRGDFDHYLSTLDMVGYKIVTGNMFFMPMLGKVNEGNIDKEDDVNDYILHVQYDNPETDLSLGLLYQIRVGSGNDIVSNSSYMGGTGSTRTGDYKHSYIGLFTSQKMAEMSVGVEVGMLSGDTGVKTATNQDVKLNGFGVAGELGWAPTDSKWSTKLLAGFASGDDPGSNDTQEGMVMHRNYRVGMLMFTHPMGQRDFFRTGLYRSTATSVASQIDTEAISNALYIAPSVKYKSNDKWSYGATLVTGRLNKEPIAGGNTASDLGYEVDLNMTWTPFDRFTWTTEMGLFAPGETWKAGSAGLDNSFAYGLMTKAAIRF
ncbi:MAG: hypothetical protein JNJ49_09750 [Bdellovibrionaceae bacterium]|nr:hypothetical protein [Pseudobdellovibrionaceae bacterium]